MAHGILIGSNSSLPAIGKTPNGNITTCTQIFSCHEYKTGSDLTMFTGSKEPGVYVVSYSISPAISGDIDRRWLYYSNSEYLIALGSNIESVSLVNYYYEASEHYTNYYYGNIGSNLGEVSNLVYNSAIYNYDSLEEALAGEGIVPYGEYPITYSYTNSTVSGPSSAVVSDTVTVSAVPDVGYGITDASTQILVTNNDVAVPYTWDAATNHITFTMPDPS